MEPNNENLHICANRGPFPGRSAELKAEIAREFTGTLERVAGIKPEARQVLFIEIELHDWIVAGKPYGSPPKRDDDMEDAAARDMRIKFKDLELLLSKIFTRHGVAEANASILASNCAGCERDGSISHGIFRMPGYVASLESGWVNGTAIPELEDVGPAYRRVDARNGFAQPALVAAMPWLIETAHSQGVAVVAIRDSHHFSALWPDLEPLARDGLVALSMVSGLACVAPPGGTQPVFGTNPIAFATPVAGTDPMIWDFATSAMSNGDLRIAAREGHSVPLGTGIDASGDLSDNPAAILAGGALLPFGGHKGAALSLMVEILASALTGGQFSSEVDFSRHSGAETPKTGQLIIAIDPARGGNDHFTARVAQLVDAVRSAGQPRLPSDRRYKTRRASQAEGILIETATYEKLLSYIE
ncbi:Ldh family oxidoreductase [Rhizobium sp. AU243]|uniref:Ldh family oxidoreductase n=1 Tax=Rhizobium sp. AU243 TaxID=2303425 RepID=UPI0010CBD4E2|nr:Ldh family oxidoreductase [Rhizobium sp. AU243]TKV70764.1 Ldh family oxidoreductase [Rhizobium sp. AU243]